MLSTRQTRPFFLSLAALPLLAGSAMADAGGPTEYHVVLAGQQQAHSPRSSHPSISSHDSDLRRQHVQRRRHRPRRRRLPDFYQLYSGPGYEVVNPLRAWGTFTTVMRLRDAFSAYHERFPDARPLMIHDISSRRGGLLKPHVSHRYGRDVDIRLVLKHTTAYVKASPRSLDLERMWFFVRTLVQTGDVQYVFLDYRLQGALYRYAKRQGVSIEELRATFQYPRGRHGPGIVRHAHGHRDHIHVRFFRRPKSASPLVASAR